MLKLILFLSIFFFFNQIPFKILHCLCKVSFILSSHSSLKSYSLKRGISFWTLKKKNNKINRKAGRKMKYCPYTQTPPSYLTQHLCWLSPRSLKWFSHETLLLKRQNALPTCTWYGESKLSPWTLSPKQEPSAALKSLKQCNRLMVETSNLTGIPGQEGQNKSQNIQPSTLFTQPTASLTCRIC